MTMVRVQFKAGQTKNLVGFKKRQKAVATVASNGWVAPEPQQQELQQVLDSL